LRLLATSGLRVKMVFYFANRPREREGGGSGLKGSEARCQNGCDVTMVVSTWRFGVYDAFWSYCFGKIVDFYVLFVQKVVFLNKIKTKV
jgi:hypothetical protein